jgi:transcriptional antiterminator RfaH
MAGERPATLPYGVVEILKASRDKNGLIPLRTRLEFHAGEAVRVSGGCFAERLGLFQDSRDNDRAEILIEMLGRPVRITMPDNLIDKAA